MMVLGIKEGSVEIVLPKRDYSSGERIKGRLVLTLDSPKKARGLRVELKAEQKGAAAPKGTVVVPNVVFDLVSEVKGEGTFNSSKYDFELQIPKSAQDAVKDKATGTGPVRWYVTASLDIPLAFDIKDRKEIFIDHEGMLGSEFVSRLKGAFHLQ